MNSYDLSRKWFDWCFENPEKVKPIHSALYFFAIEHCNRLGWKEKFGLPTEMTKDAIGVKCWKAYIKAFNDLSDFGFFIIIERSKNQYSSNIIALSYNTKAHDKAHDKALDKALDKAIAKHTTKHTQSTRQSKPSINKQLTNKPFNSKQATPSIKKEVFDNVFLEQKEIDSLIVKYGETDTQKMFEKLSNYKTQEGKQYKSDYGAINNWVVKWLAKEKQTAQTPNLTPKTDTKEQANNQPTPKNYNVYSF